MNVYTTTKKHDDIATPPELLSVLNQEFHFDCDPAPFKSKIDGLSPNVIWGRMSYVNPPYSNIRPWLERGVQELKSGRSSLFLIPLRPGTSVWREII
jgi:hypothetical protein